MTYQPGIPTGSVPLNQDYLNLQGNFTSLNNQWLVDHVPLTTAPGPSIGFHTAIHLVPQSPPSVINGYGELYCQTTNDGINSGQQLFWQWEKSGPTTVNVPLTRNFAPVASANGYTFLPGGLILQWGKALTVGSASVISFPITFPANCYNVSLTIAAPNPAPSLNIAADLLTTSNFTLRINTAGTLNLFWIAIGN